MRQTMMINRIEKDCWDKLKMDVRKRRDRGLLALGMLGVLILQGLAIPMNGEILFPIHDQLDGEILTYILKAHAPFSASIPQLFNGISASSMTPPAILFTIPYMFCSPADHLACCIYGDVYLRKKVIGFFLDRCGDGIPFLPSSVLLRIWPFGYGAATISI